MDLANPDAALKLASLRSRLSSLAEHGVYIGTSSWKYEGWIGQLYTSDRYHYRGRFSEARFNRQCLSEYSEVFCTVGVDAAYYQFPRSTQLLEMASQTPESFRFSLKVTDDITIRKFPNMPRFGTRAGTLNSNFLDSGLFTDQFLGPCEVIRSRLGAIMFEFSKFYTADFEKGRMFIDALSNFLERIPRGWPYAVELRNANFLQPEYFEMLRMHGVAHLFNSWQAMPSLSEQVTLNGSITSDEVSVARLLLKPGTTYADAVKKFSPYRDIKEIYTDGRNAAVALIQKTLHEKKPKRLFIYINNRFEGNALQTIEAILDALQAMGPAPS